MVDIKLTLVDPALRNVRPRARPPGISTFKREIIPIIFGFFLDPITNLLLQSKHLFGLKASTFVVGYASLMGKTGIG